MLMASSSMQFPLQIILANTAIEHFLGIGWIAVPQLSALGNGAICDVNLNSIYSDKLCDDVLNEFDSKQTDTQRAN